MCPPIQPTARLSHHRAAHHWSPSTWTQTDSSSWFVMECKSKKWDNIRNLTKLPHLECWPPPRDLLVMDQTRNALKVHPITIHRLDNIQNEYTGHTLTNYLTFCLALSWVFGVGQKKMYFHILPRTPGAIKGLMSKHYTLLELKVWSLIHRDIGWPGAWVDCLQLPNLTLLPWLLLLSSRSNVIIIQKPL